MDQVSVNVETTFGVSASLPTNIDDSSAGFGGVVFTDCGEPMDIPAFGKTWNVASRNPTSTKATLKKRSTYNNGQMTVLLSRDDDDAGQVLLLAALATDDSAKGERSFEVQYEDGSADCFTAIVTSFQAVNGAAGAYCNRQLVLELTSDVVEIASA